MPNSTPVFSFERQCCGPVCGVDEAGRGPLAGPVVAAAVILTPEKIPEGLNDSKILSEIRRELLLNEIIKTAEIGIGIAEPEEIPHQYIRSKPDRNAARGTSSALFTRQSLDRWE